MVLTVISLLLHYLVHHHPGEHQISNLLPLLRGVGLNLLLDLRWQKWDVWDHDHPADPVKRLILLTRLVHLDHTGLHHPLSSILHLLLLVLIHLLLPDLHAFFSISLILADHESDAASYATVVEKAKKEICDGHWCRLAFVSVGVDDEAVFAFGAGTR